MGGWAGGEEGGKRREEERGEREGKGEEEKVRGRRKGSCLFSFAFQIQDIYKIKIWSKAKLGENLAMIHMH